MSPFPVKKILCFGEVLLRLAAPNKEPLLQSASLVAGFGGAETNVGIALSYLGLEARVATSLPQNPVGDACVGELRRHGLDTSGILRRPGRMGLYFLASGAMLRPARVLYDRQHSAFADADPDSYDWAALLTGVDWLHVSGITPAVGAKAAAALAAGLAAARARRIPISLDCNFRASLWQGREAEASHTLRAIAEQSELLIASQFDLARLLDFDPPLQFTTEYLSAAVAAAFKVLPNLRYLAGTERLTKNSDHQTLSAYLADRNAVTVSRSFELTPIIERIGGGDAFAAGILYGLCSDLCRQENVDFAVAAAALKHCLPGDFSTASAADVRALLQDGSRDVQR